MPEGHVKVNGVRLWYEERGRADGPPVVLVMGVGASVLWWPPALVESLVEAGFRVVLFDNRDIGLSSHVDFASAPYTLADLASDTIGLLDARGLAAAHLVGVSMGGMIGQELAIRHPARVRSLVLITSTPGPDPRLAPPTEAFMAFVSRAPDPERSEVDGVVDFCRVLAGSRFPFDDGFYRALVTADLARGTNLASSHGVIPATSPSRVDELAAIKAPTLVVHGTEDPLFPRDHGQLLARGISGAALVEWEGVGHEVPPQLAPELGRHIIRHVREAG